MSEFQITSLPLLQGTLGLCPAPGRSGAFENDMKSLIEWRPDLVISLVEDAEMARLGATGLGNICQTNGIGWLHLPITDFGVPDAVFMTAWEFHQPDLIAQLHSGQRIVIHCMGGCGRTGMIALRLMIAAGEDAIIALARLRAARPCAIETAAQMDWAVSKEN